MITSSLYISETIVTARQYNGEIYGATTTARGKQSLQTGATTSVTITTTTITQQQQQQ
jgi:hypothetical protein